ncbi:hypothetical protein ACOME3_007446 [Neoechinorhynchus agilis]
MLLGSLKNVISSLEQRSHIHCSSLARRKNLTELPKEPTKWIEYNRTVYPPVGPDELKINPFFHHIKAFVRGSVKKYWYAAQLVRGMSVQKKSRAVGLKCERFLFEIDEALKQLSFYKTREGHTIKDAIREARELALKSECFEFKSNMWISYSAVSRALVIKSMREHMRGPMYIERHRYSHYFVRLEEGKPPKHFYPPLPSLKQRIDEHVESVRERILLRSETRRTSMALAFTNRLLSSTIWNTMKQTRDRFKQTVDLVTPLSKSQQKVSEAESTYLTVSQQRQRVEDELALVHASQGNLHSERRLAGASGNRRLHDDLHLLVQIHELNKRERSLCEQLCVLIEREEEAFSALEILATFESKGGL